MKEILLAILLPQLFVLPLLLALRAVKKDKDGGEDTVTHEVTEMSLRVLEILREAYTCIKRQGGSGYGPWLAAAIENECGDAGVALTAIRWTVRDLDAAPVSYDKDGREMPRRKFKIDGLLKAEAELKEIMGAGD